MSKENPIGRETQCKIEMEHKELKDLTFFPVEETGREAPGRSLAPSASEQIRQKELTFSTS